MKTKLIKIAAASLLMASTSANADWSIYGLGTLGGTQSYAADINNLGQVVGWGNLSAQPELNQAFITGPNGTSMTGIDMPGSSYSSKARGINDSGQVTGYFSFLAANPYYPDYSYSPIAGFIHSFITGPNGIGSKDLGVIKGYFTDMGEYNEDSLASDINESGQVSRTEVNAQYQFITRAIMTGPNGEDMHVLNIPSFSARATAINDSGQVVGSTNDFEYLPWNYGYAFITGPNGSGITFLGNFGGHYTAAYGVNNAGQVVGSSDLPADFVGGYFPGYDDIESHAFVTGPNGTGITDLGTLGGKRSTAFDINEPGQIIGISTIADGTSHSFLYTDGHMIDLSLLPAVINAGWSNIIVSAINDHGLIAGYGIINGHNQAFLLSPDAISPIPEPTTYAMLLAGLGLLFFRTKTELNS